MADRHITSSTQDGTHRARTVIVVYVHKFARSQPVATTTASPSLPIEQLIELLRRQPISAIQVAHSGLYLNRVPHSINAASALIAALRTSSLILSTASMEAIKRLFA